RPGGQRSVEAPQEAGLRKSAGAKEIRKERSPILFLKEKDQKNFKKGTMYAHIAPSLFLSFSFCAVFSFH
ncbi:MAG: hypothetical protein IJI82_09030, partial [Clostridia bacterium]|nr:hypothetical protein [Clostridia bacterium]